MVRLPGKSLGSAANGPARAQDREAAARVWKRLSDQMGCEGHPGTRELLDRPRILLRD